MRRFVAATQDRVTQDGPANSVPIVDPRPDAVEKILARFGLGEDAKR